MSSDESDAPKTSLRRLTKIIQNQEENEKLNPIGLALAAVILACCLICPMNSGLAFYEINSEMFTKCNPFLSLTSSQTCFETHKIDIRGKKRKFKIDVDLADLTFSKEHDFMKLISPALT